jgi:DNA-binding PadR family transcriptional regulator
MGSQAYRGEFEQIVLLAILRLGEDAYGGSVGREIEARTGRSTSRGALYVTLDRLEEKALLSSRLGRPTPARGGRARRHLKVTAGGLDALRACRASLQSLWQGLDEVLQDP